ncbi:unnamed protein product [Haemonchus placei]|uniref:Uncharacterized protein n=1 Tax=Haemonchus placei TaxID=6290 RepID=A0A0N4VUK1_HAEPC|nr:unnamed protein product [Haemonchus placei]
MSKQSFLSAVIIFYRIFKNFYQKSCYFSLPEAFVASAYSSPNTNNQQYSPYARMSSSITDSSPPRYDAYNYDLSNSANLLQPPVDDLAKPVARERSKSPATTRVRFADTTSPPILRRKVRFCFFLSKDHIPSHTLLNCSRIKSS